MKQFLTMQQGWRAVIAMALVMAGQQRAGAQEPLQDFIASVEGQQSGMTLWEMVQAGGIVMWALGLLSVVAVAIIIYNFLTLKVGKLVPPHFVEAVVEKLEARKEDQARKLCVHENNIIATIVSEGLDKKRKGVVFAREAMENATRQAIGNLWQNISYLGDIASVAPLVGLLGTVIGMIRAFNVIAFQTAVVKPVLLAGGVSQAMVTTAAGLIVAIPVMLFYSYFRGRVQKIANEVESYSTDIIKMIEETGPSV